MEVPEAQPLPLRAYRNRDHEPSRKLVPRPVEL